MTRFTTYGLIFSTAVFSTFLLSVGGAFLSNFDFLSRLGESLTFTDTDGSAFVANAGVGTASVGTATRVGAIARREAASGGTSSGSGAASVNTRNESRTVVAGGGSGAISEEKDNKRGEKEKKNDTAVLNISVDVGEEDSIKLNIGL